MRIQVNTDTNVDGHERLVEYVSATIEHALERFSDHVTRVEVHLSDENGGKSGPQDQRCLLEARLEGRQPVVVTETAGTQDQAVHGAAQKLVRLLDSTLGRTQAKRERAIEPAPFNADPAQPG